MFVQGKVRENTGEGPFRVTISTTKSLLGPGYGSERLIEPSSSWFPPEFPSILLKLTSFFTVKANDRRNRERDLLCM